MDDFRYIKEVIARKHIYDFAQYVMAGFKPSPFHEMYYGALNLFAHRTINKLIVSVPPQHGKSLGSSQLLPAYMLGLNPSLKIAVSSYAFGLATQFNKRTQRIMTSDAYSGVFPLSRLKENSLSPSAPSYPQTSEGFEVVDNLGGMRSVGRGGGLTGNEVDIMIMDDLYKDRMEGNSPTIRDAVWEWYTSVVKTRLHNGSSELIVFTRWHEDDLIGLIEATEQVLEITSLSQVDPNFRGWYKLNFEAIKESDPTEIDPREKGTALWPEKHNIELLTGKRNLDRHTFNCMYQGRPESKEGMLYGDNFQTYTDKPEIIKKANYTDTADTGADYLCSICYEVSKDGFIYITDVLYTPADMEETEPATAAMLNRNNTRIAYVESNNGGRGFARALSRCGAIAKIEWFHQSGNKEARILTNSATVLKYIKFPADWKLRWPKLHDDLTTYKRIFRANKSDDAPDALTGIIEREITPKTNKILAIH